MPRPHDPRPAGKRRASRGPGEPSPAPARRADPRRSSPSLAALLRGSAPLLARMPAGTRTLLAAALAGALRFVAWLAPRAGALALALARRLAAAADTLVGAAWTHRSGMGRALQRTMWWGSLALLVVVGHALFSGFGDPELLAHAHLWFAAGLGACALVLVVAVERRLRWAAFMLGAGHGTLGLLAWVISG